MMNKKLRIITWIIIAVLLLSITGYFAIANEWVPYGDIQMKNFYMLNNSKNIQVNNNLTIGNTTFNRACEIFDDGTNLNWSCARNHSFNTSLLPGDNNTRSIGAIDYLWNKGYFTNLFVHNISGLSDINVESNLDGTGFNATFLFFKGNSTDLACSDCLNDTQIEDIYLFNTGDVMDGDLNITGNFTGNQIYGEMWNYTASDAPWTFDIDASDIYYNITNLVAGDLNGFTFTDGGAVTGTYLTAKISGLYKACLTMSFLSQANGGLYGVAVVHNYNVSKHRDCYARREAATAVGNVGVCCLIDLDDGDNVSIQAENENTNRDMLIHTVNLNLFRVGD